MTIDNLYHALLGLAVAIVVGGLSFVSHLLAAWAAGSLLLFFRELTQIQNVSFNDNFLMGWDRNFDFSQNHVREWLYPSIALAILCLAIAMLIGVR
jgi:hypothetical protein